MSPITTHVLDTSIGKPAANIPVVLEFNDGGVWKKIGEGSTDKDGRAKELMAGKNLSKGSHRITFELKKYFSDQNRKSFYPHVTIYFDVDSIEHYHVPLLLSGFGFSTYRGT